MTIVGTRPELIKMSRVIAEFDEHTKHILVHTGQNYDYELNQLFFEDLEIRKPDHFLEAVGENDLINLSLRLVARGPWSSCHPGKKSEGDVEGAIDNSGRRGNDAGQTSCSDSSGRRTAHRLQLHEA